MNKLCLFLLFLSVSTAVGQPTPPPNAHTENIPVSDLSPAGSPVKFSGSPVPCYAWEENGWLNVTAKGGYQMSNVSGRTIVAILGYTEEACLSGGAAGNSIAFDLFFKPAGIPVAEVIDFPIDMNEGMRFNGGGHFDFTAPSRSRIFVKALWAQFEDGSQWGDKAAGAELLRKRAESLEFYQRLVNESSEQTKLLATLEENAPRLSTEGMILRSLNEYRSQYGIPAVILMIKDKLRIGQERMATGKF